MIYHIKGALVEKNPAYVVLETAGGVGYLIHISLNTFSQLKDEQQVKLLTHYVVKEDSQTLYGFYDESERTLFRLLISVNGIGPNTACVILSALSVQDVVNAIANQDLRTIQSVKGIGAKTAQRVVIELKDKIAKASFDVQQDNFSTNYNNNKIEALSALIALGFAKNSAEKVLDKIIKDNGSDLSVEDLIKKALKLL
ncbi:MAG: Holliday junction branch migration protein RuvA [Bacteroidales bacterium]|nr:Holliday junction branch migration protein RuvA [Bacteroidales bacterium]